MRDDALHQPLPQASSTIGFQDEDVANVCIGCEIADRPGKTGLLVPAIQAKAQRVLQRAADRLFRNSFGPVAIREERMNRVDIQASAVSADQELAPPVLLN